VLRAGSTTRCTVQTRRVDRGRVIVRRRTFDDDASDRFEEPAGRSVPVLGTRSRRRTPSTPDVHVLRVAVAAGRRGRRAAGAVPWISGGSTDNDDPGWTRRAGCRPDHRVLTDPAAVRGPHVWRSRARVLRSRFFRPDSAHLTGIADGCVRHRSRRNEPRVPEQSERMGVPAFTTVDVICSESGRPDFVIVPPCRGVGPISRRDVATLVASRPRPCWPRRAGRHHALTALPGIVVGRQVARPVADSPSVIWFVCPATRRGSSSYAWQTIATLHRSRFVIELQPQPHTFLPFLAQPGGSPGRRYEPPTVKRLWTVVAPLIDP